MSATDVAVVAACGYFAVFGTAFVFRPELVSQFGLKWVDPAGRTEVRCYYGAVSWALSAFLGYLLARHRAVDALTGVLFLAVAVLVARVVGTTVDRAWRERYTKVALPTETVFVVVLAAVRLFS